MTLSFQLVIDRADKDPLAHFWAAALGYVLEPDGFASLGVGGSLDVPIETRRQRVDAEAARLAGLGAVLVGARDGRTQPLRGRDERP